MAPTKTTGELRAKVARAVMAADPSAADRQRAKSEAERRVTLRDDGQGTATLTGWNLPAAPALAAANRLNALARAFKADGDKRRLDAIRADVFLALLLGLLPTSAIASSDTAAIAVHDGGVDVDLDDVCGTEIRPWYEENDGSEGDAERPVWDAEVARGAGNQVGTVQLTVPLTTYLGLADQPGEVAGYGPILADTARTLAENADAARWCVTVTDEQGQAIAHGETAYRPSKATRSALA